jgi:hypothetical protein
MGSTVIFYWYLSCVGAGKLTAGAIGLSYYAKPCQG